MVEVKDRAGDPRELVAPEKEVQLWVLMLKGDTPLDIGDPSDLRKILIIYKGL